MTRPAAVLQARADAHNASVNLPMAVAGFCGMTHLSTGRICVLPARHGGSCAFCPPEDILLRLGVDPEDGP